MEAGDPRGVPIARAALVMGYAQPTRERSDSSWSCSRGINMFSWVKKKIQGKGPELFPQLSEGTKNKLNDACKMVHQLFPEDEDAAVRVLEVLDVESMPDCDYRNVLYRPDYNGWTILQEAVMVNNIKLLELLLDTFPFDLNDATRYQTKLPLHLACLHGKSEIVDILLKRGAKMTIQCESIAIYADKYNFLKRHQLYAKYKGTVLWYALAMDTSEVCQVLCAHGLRELYSTEDLITAAIAFNSSQCIKYLLEDSVQDLCRTPELAMKSLYEASKKCLDLVQVLLASGCAFDDTFCEQYPDVLQQYYSNVGMTDIFKEASCTEFTRIVLEDYKCAKILKEKIEYGLLAKLISRTTRNMKNFQREEVDTFYEDVQSCIRLLVKHNPNLPNEVQDAIEMVMNAIYHKYRFADVQGSISNHMRLVELLLELGFKPDGGYCCPLLLLVKLPAPFIDGTSTPCKEFTTSFVHLTHKFLQSGCDPNSVGSYGRPVLHRFIGNLFLKNQYQPESFPFRVELFTTMVDLLCAAGLNTNVQIEHSCPAESFRNGVHKTTYLQNLITLLEPIKVLQRAGVVELLRPILNVIVVFAGERTNFDDEFKHGDFKAVMGNLGSCFVQCTTNPYMQPDSSQPRLTPASIAVAKTVGYLMSLMTQEQRRMALEGFMGGKSENPNVMNIANFPRPPLGISGELESTMNMTIEKEILDKVNQPMSLKDCSVSVIRRPMVQYIQPEPHVLDCYPMVSQERKTTEVFPGVGHVNCNPLASEDSVGRQRSIAELEMADPKSLIHKEVMMLIKDGGVRLAKYHCLDSKVDKLPLPQAMKDCVIGKGLLEVTLVDLWRTFKE